MALIGKFGTANRKQSLVFDGQELERSASGNEIQVRIVMARHVLGENAQWQESITTL
jgi:hypothetical protein